jgi:hypothetical protein
MVQKIPSWDNCPRQPALADRELLYFNQHSALQHLKKVP